LTSDQRSAFVIQRSVPVIQRSRYVIASASETISETLTPGRLEIASGFALAMTGQGWSPAAL